MPKFKKKINYSILIKKIKIKKTKKKLFSFKQKFYFLLIKVNFFYSNLFLLFFSEDHHQIKPKKRIETQQKNIITYHYYCWEI